MIDVVEFESHRPVMFGIAYRMLGERAAAEDVVQEAFLKARDNANPESPRAWLATVVTRLCLDHLKSARARRERYVGPWLPEPIPTEDGPDPLTSRETISIAFLVLLDALSPAERAVFLLHDVFDYSHSEVAAIVGKEEASVRQLLRRAKGRLVEKRPRFCGSSEQHQRLLMGFVNACALGDVDGLKQLLAEDVISTSDGGGKRQAARKPVAGADRVARMMIGLIRKNGAGLTYEVRMLNGEPAIVGYTSEPSMDTSEERVSKEVESVLTIATDGARITAVNILRNPDKLARI